RGQGTFQGRQDPAREGQAGTAKGFRAGSGKGFHQGFFKAGCEIIQGFVEGFDKNGGQVLAEDFLKGFVPRSRTQEGSRVTADRRDKTPEAFEKRDQVPPAPRGWDRFRWYGPGLLWMLSSVGSGSVLFTPRVGARYGYILLWAVLLVIFFQWVWSREVGRYTVVSGRTLLDGLRDMPGLRGWVLWSLFVPQLLAAVVTFAGIAALAGSALMEALPGSQ